MSFFIRNRSNHGNDTNIKNKLKRKLAVPKLSKRKAKFVNEDISSDEEDLLYDNDGKFVDNESEEERYEDVQEVAYRKAKQLLDDLQVFYLFFFKRVFSLQIYKMCYI
ncbi:unnamed protein product [Brugia pahangi]|uniref:Uncharacterized protein n=1 Tax=Brugia pahangi TaxID=6280 RepID=A0A0N4TGA4_BRUPA|nr:unnamed protein product [Brugia pahangi]